ncbi:ABC transporter permease [bacterium]|nr:ABC transporter permease [bacterium]
MNFYLTAFQQAISALWAYKGRTLLTMLGIVIGIGTIIVMVSIGQGANQAIQDQINRMGTNLLYAISGSSKKGGVRGGQGSQPTLRLKDVQAISRLCPSVKEISYQINGVVQAIAENKNWGTTLQGAVPTYAAITNWTLQEGEFLSEQHLRRAANVAVLGSVVAENLFDPGTDVIGRRIRLRKVPFTVIGVLTSKGRTPDGRDADDVIIIPYTTAVSKLMGRELPGMVHFIMASARSKELVPRAKWEMETALRQSHRIPAGDDDDFIVGTLDEFAEAAAESTAIMRLLLIAVASISLVVGGIGIMNIMLVTVTERTREIGVRMAIGAKQRDILTQFLVESITMSIAGGIAGTALGIAASRFISAIAGWPTIISPESIVVATFFSALIGIFFGYYPARKASRLDPIEALRHE